MSNILTIDQAKKVNNEQEFKDFLLKNNLSSLITESNSSNKKQTKLNILTHMGNGLQHNGEEIRQSAQNAGRLFECVVAVLFGNKESITSFPGNHKMQNSHGLPGSNSPVQDANYDIVINGKKEVIQTKLTYSSAKEFYSSSNKLTKFRPYIENGYVIKQKKDYTYYFVVFENNIVKVYKTKLNQYLNLCKQIMKKTETMENGDKINLVSNGNGMVIARIQLKDDKSEAAIIPSNISFFKEEKIFSEQQVLDAINYCINLKNFKTKNEKMVDDGKRLPNKTTENIKNVKGNFQFIQKILETMGGRSTGIFNVLESFKLNNNQYETNEFYGKVYNAYMANKNDNHKLKGEVIKLCKEEIVSAALNKFRQKEYRSSNKNINGMSIDLKDAKILATVYNTPKKEILDQNVNNILDKYTSMFLNRSSINTENKYFNY